MSALAALPAASDAIAQTFHPQDLMSVGFACAGHGPGAAPTMGGWWACCSAWPSCASSSPSCPCWRSWPPLRAGAARARVVVPAGAVVAAGVVPFYVVAPVATVRAMTAVYVAGVTLVKTPTVVGVLTSWRRRSSRSPGTRPSSLAAVLVVWARRRAGAALLAPAPLVGLALACLATRLVFEISLLNYYFLAVAVRPGAPRLHPPAVPVWSVMWIVATRFVLTPLAPHVPLTLTAALFLVAALVPIGLGLAAGDGGTSPRRWRRRQSVGG